jgi:ATP-dependent RNA helicase DDX54/DBP10
MKNNQRGYGYKPKANNNEEDEESYQKLASSMQEFNRRNKKSGGFQSMGLNPEIFRGIIKKGYKVPTPIQRKTIPMILEGRDVVGMARTGSGKTAAFLIPLFQKLLSKGIGVGNSKGARALILSPTRELALQVSVHPFLSIKFYQSKGWPFMFSDCKVLKRSWTLHWP